jgi:hypothetical protein
MLPERSGPNGSALADRLLDAVTLASTPTGPQDLVVSLMLPLALLAALARTGLEVLCLGAPSDDLEIGRGGTMLRLLRELSTAA